MIKIDVIHLADETNFPVNSSSLIKKLKVFLENQNVKNAELVVVITGEKEMIRLGKKYLKETDGRVHNVLSFPNRETRGKFIYPPKENNKLGEVIVCYPKAVGEAKEEGVAVDEKIYTLSEHGLKHLLGQHHN